MTPLLHVFLALLLITIALANRVPPRVSDWMFSALMIMMALRTLEMCLAIDLLELTGLITPVSYIP